MGFPALEQIIGLQQSDDVRKFIETEYGFGLPYYLNRLDRLMFSGGQVLDAGCGVGQWSIALSRRFERVEAVDLKPERLVVLERVAKMMGIQNIGIRRASLQSLPYPDGAFDAVFCYGVLLFEGIEPILSELFRVLRPGARIYACLNADGWSQYLIEERGRSDPQARAVAQQTLYHTYWRRALQRGLLESLQDKLSLLESVTRKVPPLGLLYRTVRWISERFGLKQLSRPIAELLLLRSYLRDAVLRSCGNEFADSLADDLWAVLRDARPLARWGQARAYQPQEVESFVAAAGFTDFQWAPEGQLVCDWIRPGVAPKYPGIFRGELAVWECLFVKPDIRLNVGPVEWHLEAARAAQAKRLYHGSTASPIVSNRSPWTYPQPLLEEARALAQKLGGEEYLKRLAQTLAEGARDEEEIVRRMIYFVQQAVFRDPVSQPLTEAGLLPDPLTALFCARGRCGHTSAILVELCKKAGLEARVKQFPRHVIAEVRAAARWVIADADAFKHGVIPVNRDGRLLSMGDLAANPYQLDRFPPTGWFIRPGSKFTLDAFGNPVVGYVDALTPDHRGFVSGHYVTEAEGFPPSVPQIVRFEAKGGRFLLEWTPSRVREGRLLGYRVAVGTEPRGWSYDDPGEGDHMVKALPADVRSLETTKTVVEGDLPRHAVNLFGSVTAVSDRIEKEPETYFWPSEEATCQV